MGEVKNMTNTDWEVALQQGRYWRIGAKLFLSETEYNRWKEEHDLIDMEELDDG